jgi:hypothetical protein
MNELLEKHQLHHVYLVHASDDVLDCVSIKANQPLVDQHNSGI